MTTMCTLCSRPPWRAERTFVVDADGIRVALVDFPERGYIGWSESAECAARANQRLIAAAPQLLGLLHTALEHLPQELRHEAQRLILSIYEGQQTG